MGITKSKIAATIVWVIYIAVGSQLRIPEDLSLKLVTWVNICMIMIWSAEDIETGRPGCYVAIVWFVFLGLPAFVLFVNASMK